MKLTKLLVLNVLMLFGVSAQAADLIERTAPEQPGSAVIDEAALAAIEKVAVEFEVGKYYVLYNTGAKQYYSQGNNWGTRASVSDLPILVRFTIPEGKTLADNALYLNDYCIYNNGWRLAFFDSATGIFVDRGSQANFYWQVIAQGNNVYRLQASPANPTFTPTNNPGFVGRDPEVPQDNGNNEGSRNVNLENTFPLSPFMESGWIDWEFYAVPEWNAYGVLLDTYNKSIQLKKEIGVAEEKGVDVSAAVNVYNDENSTIAQMDAAIAALGSSMSETYASGNGEKPGDASFLIANATFDTIGDFAGWQGSSFGAGGTTSTNAEWYEFNQNSDTYQQLSGLKPGYYIAGVKGFYRAGDTNASYTHFKAQDNSTKSVQLYVIANGQTYETTIVSNFQGVPTATTGFSGEANAVDNETNVTYYVPNTMAAAEKFMHQLGLYDNFVLAQVGEDGALRIGVKKSGEKIGSDWAIFDDFTLYYIGTNPDDYYPGLAYLKMQSYPKYENVLATKRILEAYQSALNSNDERLALRSQEALDAFIAKIDAAKAELDANIALWSKWDALVKQAQGMFTEEKYFDFDEIEPLLDYADPDTETSTFLTIKAELRLENDALQAEIEKLEAMIDDLINAQKNAIKEGDDVTYMLKNPKFDDLNNDGSAGTPEAGWIGWHNTTNSMPTTGGLTDVKKSDYNITAEAWSAKEFDLYQEVENAPAGVYEIEVQGFYRYGRNDEAYNIYVNKDVDYVKEGGAPVFVYMNDVKQPFKNVYDEESLGMEFYAPMAEVDENNEPRKADESGLYIWRDIPYSVQNYPTSDPTHFYPNGMTSAAMAFSAGKYKQSASSLIAKKGDKMRIGVKGSTQQPSQGDCWVIFDNFKLTYKGFTVEGVKPVLEKAIADAKNNLDKGFGVDLRETLIEKLEAAEAVLNSEDGKVMFAAAAELVAVDVDASVALFEKLAAEVATMQANASNQSGITDDATVNAAYELGEEISGKMESFTLTDVEANEYLEKIAEMNAKLMIPAGMTEASDDNPVNATSLIKNPNYANNTDDGWNGGAGVNFHEAEMFNKTFDYYQDLENLLPGTYKLTIQGFYRAGGHGAAIDYTKWQADATADNNAVLYAKTADEYYASTLKRLCTEGIQLAEGEEIPGGWGAMKTDTLSWEPDTVVQHTVVPNNMEQAEVAFQKTDDAFNYSGIEVIFKVGEDGKARIGVKKDVAVENDWTIWTNWTLTYYGANSTLEPTLGVKSIATDARVVKTEYYSLSGSRLNTARGLVIVKETLSDGSVRMTKRVK